MALEQDQINSLVDGIVSRYRDADFQTTLEQAMDAAGADKGDRYLIRLEIGRRTAPASAPWTSGTTAPRSSARCTE